MNYLFENANQGYYSTYIPFHCSKVLTQEEANKLMEMKRSPRMDATLAQLAEMAEEHGFKITPYYCTYKRKIDYNEFKKFNPSDEMFFEYSKKIDDLRLDFLPNDFKDWEIIKAVSGNY